MVMVQGILISILCVYVIYKILNLLFIRWKLIKFCKSLPGPKQAVQTPTVNSEESLFSACYLKQFPRLHTMWRGPFLPFVSVHHPDTIKPIIKTVGLKKNGYLTAYHRLSLLYNSLTASDIEGWPERRETMGEFLNAEKRLQYQSQMKDSIDTAMCGIGRSIGCNKSRSIDMFPVINRLLLDIHLKTFFSQDSKNRLFDSNEYLRLEKDYMDLFYYRHMKWYLYPDWIFYLTTHGFKDIMIRRKMDALVQVLIDRKQKVHQRRLLPTCKDVVDCMINKQTRISLCHSALEMLVGRRGVVSAISWTLVYLAKHKKYQEAMRNETKILFDDDVMRTHLQEQDFSQLKVTNMFLKEVLRICPPIPSTERQITEDITIDDITFPAGTCFYVNIYGLHHNEELWEDPEEFKPERFKERSNTSQHLKYSPFLAYSRRCVAKNFSMECITIIVARLLQRYMLTLDEEHTISKDVRFHQVPDKGLHIILTEVK